MTLRRSLIRAAGFLAATFIVASCKGGPVGPIVPDAETIAKLTITARPAAPTITPTVGYSPLGLAAPRDGFLYVPTTYNPATPAPMLVLLHGASGSASDWQTTDLQAYAEQQGMILLATESRYQTWDGPLLARYDVDVAFLNSALLHAFARVNVDVNRVAIVGFSDGASEALGVGIANAGLFRKIVAFSPGGLNSPFSRGEPDVFVSHGLSDPVTPFSNTSNFIVPVLRNNGMEVEFFIFEGGHLISEDARAAAFAWLVDAE